MDHARNMAAPEPCARAASSVDLSSQTIDLPEKLTISRQAGGFHRPLAQVRMNLSD
jgi:hypothetical protein